MLLILVPGILRASGRIAIPAAMDTSMVHADIHTLHAPALLTLPCVLLEIQPVSGQAADLLLINARTVSDSESLEIHLLRAGK